MKLNETITINPPPYTDHTGKITHPNPIALNERGLVFTDHVKNRTVHVNIRGIPMPLTLWSGNEYDTIGDWTQVQAENKITELLGDNVATKLRSLFPKTLEETPNHPGTLLSKMIKSLGFVMSDSCSCKRHALEMNEKGNDWCSQNVDTVVGWLREEAHRRNLPFIDTIGKLMVNRAIKKSRKLLANEPVPENDEELDNS